MTVAGVVDPAHQAHDIVSNPEATMAASHDRWNAIADGHVSSTLAKYWNNPGTALAQDVYTAKHSIPLVQGALHALDRTPVGVALEHADAYTVALAGNLIGGTAHLAVHQAELYGPILNEYVVPGGYPANRAMGITDPFANARKAWHRDPAGTAAEGLSALASVFGGVAGATRAGAAEGAAAGAGRSAATQSEPQAAVIPRSDGPGHLIKRDPNRRSAPLTTPTGDRPLGGAGQRPSNRSDTAGNRPPAGPGTRTPNRQEPNRQLADVTAGTKPPIASANSVERPPPLSKRPTDNTGEKSNHGPSDGPPQLNPSPTNRAGDATTSISQGTEGPESTGTPNNLSDPSIASAPRYPNQLPNELSADLAQASRLGAEPVRPGSPGFESAVNSGTVKWAVLQNGDLVLIPKLVQGVEIKHSVLSSGQPVLAAGEADVAGSAGTGYLGLEINTLSGHFKPPASSLELGLKEFERAGIRFPKDGITPE